MTRTIAALGDVSSLSCWSGVPCHFWQAAQASGFATLPWKTDLTQVQWQRFVWNLLHIKNGVGGFQYSPWFLKLMEQQIDCSLMATEVITFNQHFPRANTIAKCGGRLNHYIDAPFSAFTRGKGLILNLPRNVMEKARELEKENFQASDRIITMARWAADAVLQDYAIPESKVHTILPGANCTLPTDWSFPEFVEGAGIKREFVFGFIGKDWERKGLPWLLKLCDELSHRHFKVKVRAAGHAPHDLQRREHLDFVGFLDKGQSPAAFVNFLSGCDVGCLFSSHEALGISTLEFLRAGVPVAGFAHEGIADSLPVDAGFRFSPSISIPEAADIFEEYIKNEAQQRRFYENAKRWSGLVTWERCIKEFEELWKTSHIKNPVRPWLGLPTHVTES